MKGLLLSIRWIWTQCAENSHGLIQFFRITIVGRYNIKKKSGSDSSNNCCQKFFSHVFKRLSYTAANMWWCSFSVKSTSPYLFLAYLSRHKQNTIDRVKTMCGVSTLKLIGATHSEHLLRVSLASSVLHTSMHTKINQGCTLRTPYVQAELSHSQNATPLYNCRVMNQLYINSERLLTHWVCSHSSFRMNRKAV